MLATLGPSFAARIPVQHPAGGLRSLLDMEDRRVLDAISSQITFDVHKMIYEEGELASCLYVVERGLVMLERIASDGARQVAAFILTGDLFGFEVDGRFLQSAITLKPTRLYRYPLAALVQLLEERPKIDMALRSIINRILGHTMDQLCVLGRMNARERVIYLLLHLAHREGVMDQRPLIIELPMTRLDMADFLGLTVETVSRTLSFLKRTGLINLLDAHRIEVRDPKRLMDLGERFSHV